MERIDAVRLSLFGRGAIRQLPAELKKMGIQRALIVTDRFLYDSGVADRVGAALLDGNVEYAIYYQVQPNPTIAVVNECIEAAKALEVDLLVAVGGGSAIDTAKAVSIVTANGGRVEDYEGVAKSHRAGLPIVAVNTTAGTGSEVTSFYIVTDPVKHSKMAMVDTNCMVRIAVNDVDFMMSMPPKLTAATGMDALTHAIEALLARRATPYTDKDALWAMETIYRYLPAAYADGQNEEARTMMAYAEHAAGMAFSNAGLGMVHAMAHALGGTYNLPHGVCNAVLLPYVLEFNGASPEAARRFERIVRAFHLPGAEHMSGSLAVNAGIEAIRELSHRVGIPQSLSGFQGVRQEDFASLASLAMKDTCMSDNLIMPDVEEVVSVYNRAYMGLSQ